MTPYIYQVIIQKQNVTKPGLGTALYANQFLKMK